VNPVARRRGAVLLAAALSLAGLSGCGASGPTGAPTLAQAGKVLSGHAAALHDLDRDAFLRAVSTAATSAQFRQAQADEFDNLSRLPLRAWSYQVQAPVTDAQIRAAAAKKYGTAVLILHVDVRYQIARADPVPTTRSVYWTFLRRHGRVVIAGDDDAAAQSATSWRGPWDFGHLQIVSGAHSLVLGHDDEARALPGLAQDIDRAVPAVTAVWGPGWPQYVLAIVPDSQTEAADNGGTALGPDDDVAAVAVDDGRDPLHDTTTGRRLVITPGQLARLSDTGRRLVLVHEITHLATADATTEATPAWVREGFAEYVANLGTTQPPSAVAVELTRAVRAGNLPAALPSDAQFAATASASAEAYQAAWLACRLIAAEVGRAGLVRFYRAVGAQLEIPSVAVANVLAGVVHQSVAVFTARWRAYVRAQLNG
jgi:hypothetical protein